MVAIRMRQHLEHITNILRKGYNTQAFKTLTQDMILDKDMIMASLPILKFNNKMSMHYTWLIGGILDLKPELIKDHVLYFYEHLPHANFKNYDRSVAKLFYLAGIPEPIKGEAIDQLFRWLNSSDISVSTKHYSALALCKICDDIPELKSELILVLREQQFRNKVSFEKLAARLLKQLQKP